MGAGAEMGAVRVLGVALLAWTGRGPSAARELGVVEYFWDVGTKLDFFGSDLEGLCAPAGDDVARETRGTDCVDADFGSGSRFSSS